MIISKTPYRISLFGGGSDYPGWYQENTGLTLGGAIDKYSYISLHQLPAFFDHKYRLVYAQTELVKDIESIKHPSIRAILRFKECDHDLEVHHIGDLPAQSGMGSSSAFTVGLLNAMNTLNDYKQNPKELAETSIHIEQNLMQEAVGSQDQVFSAFGGFNKIEFNREDFKVTPLKNRDQVKELSKHLLLFFTGKSRNSTINAKKIIDNIGKNKENINHLINLARQAFDIVENDKDLSLIGEMLHESWQRKQKLADNIITPEIEHIYQSARANGASGGKVLGAGGGGFVLIYANPNYHAKIKASLEDFKNVDFSFSWDASTIIYQSPDSN